MTRHTRVVVSPIENGSRGPLDGPFTFVIEMDDFPAVRVTDEETLATVVSFVHNVSRGVSCYNSNDFENSSNLNSYAAECMSDLQSEDPEAAARLESLVIDCSRLPTATKAHPIWKLDRAILRALPGVSFIE